jgi:hypothetical protein
MTSFEKEFNYLWASTQEIILWQKQYILIFSLWQIKIDTLISILFFYKNCNIDLRLIFSGTFCDQTA